MRFLVGIDDTDLPDTAGTNQLARRIAGNLPAGFAADIVVRHQLLIDPRIPYTSRNGSASIGVTGPTDSGEDARFPERLLESLREAVLAFAPHGSDPGLCVANLARPPSAELVAFGRRCQALCVDRDEAGSVAEAHAVQLEALGGTGAGVIGALAAVALRAGGNDGRVVHAAGWPWPDDFGGVRTVDAILDRGVSEIRSVGTDELITEGTIDLDRRLRPAFRDHRVVLYAEPLIAGGLAAWRALKLD